MDSFKAWKRRNKDIDEAYEAGRKKGFDEGVQIAIKVNLFQVIQLLGDKRGWKRERIAEAVKWLVKHADMMLEDYTTFQEVMDAVKDEYGIVYRDGSFIMLTDEAWETMKNAG